MTTLKNGHKHHVMKPKHRDAFRIWYELNRNCDDTAAQVGVSRGTIYDWREWYEWDKRASTLDDEVERRALNEAVKRKAEMLKRHASAGKTLQYKGLEHLKDRKIDSSRAAVQAVKVGVDIERQAEGMPQYVLDILGMSDDDAEHEYQRLQAAAAAVTGEAGSGGEIAAPDNAPVFERDTDGDETDPA